MGLEPFLAERIFTLIDKNNDDIVSFEDFVHYISILLNGSGLEKALWSFKMLSSKNIFKYIDFR
jgi:Ca2+-binding EF-hand superfamily protein